MKIWTSEDIEEMMSEHDDLSDYEIGEDNEGQLIIYTGLYLVPPAMSNWLDLKEECWVKLTKNSVPQGARPE